MPAAFTAGTALLVVLAAVMYQPLWLAPIVLYALMILADSSIHNRSLRIGLLSVAAAFVQLTGYGLGFFNAWWKRCVRGGNEFSAFDKTFYK